MNAYRFDVIIIGAGPAGVAAAGALAGTVHPIDRTFVARKLGFDAVAENSIDAVSDRDFAIEFAAACAQIMMHLSRFSEELVLWSSAEFGFISLSDAYATGSSIMPQKKNPDVAELTRGKTGRVYGSLLSLLTVMKGLPLAYNRDMHLADYLVRKGMPFREAHEVVGRAVLLASGAGRGLHDVTLDEYRKLTPLIGHDVYDALSLEASVGRRTSYGGTAPTNLKKRLQALKKQIAKELSAR